MGLDVTVDCRLAGCGRAVDAAPHLALGEQAEEALDLVDPRGRGRGEVDMPARSPGEPVTDALGLMGAGVVDDEMHFEAGRDLRFDGVEELAELQRAMAPEAAADHPADLHVECGEQ